MARVKPNALPWLGVSLLVFVLDQWSKAWVLSSLPEYTAVPVIDGFWNCGGPAQPPDSSN